MDALGDTAIGSDYEHLLQHKEQEDQEAHISVLQFADSTIRVMDDNCHSDRDKGHGDRYIGSLFRVDEPVPDDSLVPPQWFVLPVA